MVSKRTNVPKPPQSRRPPARTTAERENQLISLATELAEAQLRDGTASAQVISHYLKLGTTRERLEQERLSHENRLLEARTAQLNSQQRTEILYEEVLAAMRSYSGDEPMEDEEGWDDNY